MRDRPAFALGMKKICVGWTRSERYKKEKQGKMVEGKKGKERKGKNVERLSEYIK